MLFLAIDCNEEEHMSVYSLGALRVIDLTKPLDPKTETRRCHLYRFNTGGPIPDYHTIMDLTSHLGTHCECPYHHDDAWPDVSALPLTSFMGRGVYVEFTDLAPNSYITRADLDRVALPLIQDGDVLIFDSPHRIPPFTPLTNTDQDKRLYVNGETAQWMVDHKIKSVGFGDGVSVESSNEDIKPFHDICMAENITFLEVLENLDKLKQQTFFISFAPLPIKGLDSCPVRVYAIEGLEEFR
jgi:arylformamidase